MALPDPAPRERFHTRRFTYQCYRRHDGLWDIDAELSDIKDHPYQLHRRLVPAAEPVHHMQLRLTVDDTLTIVDMVASTLHAPFPECQQAVAPVSSMIGVRIGPGWRRTLDARIGGIRGCTHLRDLLFNAATAAFQSVTAQALHDRLQSEPPTERQGTPHFLGKCMTWALDGPVVAQYEPRFYTGKEQK